MPAAGWLPNSFQTQRFSLTSGGARTTSEMSELGFDVVDFNDLVYHFERSHIIEHLAQQGWQVSHRTVAQMHAANGFVYPDDEVASAFADVTYLNAIRS